MPSNMKRETPLSGIAKPLEWHEVEETSENYRKWEADSPFGTYRVLLYQEEGKNGYMLCGAAALRPTDEASNTLERMQLAAQEDCERRLLAGLSVNPRILLAAAFVAAAEANSKMATAHWKKSRTSDYSRGYADSSREAAQAILALTPESAGDALEEMIEERSSDRFENANIAAAETQPSWKHRCYAILSELGQDYGDPDEELPDEIINRRVAEANAECDALREQISRLLDGNQGHQAPKP